MKKLVVLLVPVLAFCMLAVASSSKDKGKNGTWSGWISDERCGAKFDSACAKKCVDAGQKAVFVDEKDKAVYAVANQDAVKSHAGHHVQVKGTLANNTLTVSSVDMLKD